MLRRSSDQLDEVEKQDDGRQNQHHRKEPEQELSADIGGERDRKSHRLCLQPVILVEADQAGGDEHLPPEDPAQDLAVHAGFDAF